MGRLKTYLWRYWRRYLVGGICLLSTATLVMWIPWWIRDAVRIIEHGGAPLGARVVRARDGDVGRVDPVVDTGCRPHHRERRLASRRQVLRRRDRSRSAATGSR